MAKKRKVEIKITKIPPKIKEIKKEDSALEEEIIATEKEENLGFAPSGPFQAPILSSNAEPEQEQRPITPVQTRNEPEFSQTRIYASQGAEFTSTVRRTYISADEAARRFTPIISSSSVDFNPQRQRVDFESDESRRMRNQGNERDYNKPLDLGEKKQERKRLPWE